MRNHAPTHRAPRKHTILPWSSGGGVERSESQIRLRRNGWGHGPSPRPAGRCPRSGRGGLFSSTPSAIALFLLPLLLLPACVQRKIRVTSTPPGARVILNDQEIGITPVETRFTFYGGYDVQLIKPGYEHIHELRQAKAPLYEYPVVDLAATAAPADLEHTTQWHFDLTPVPEATNPNTAREDLLNRAESMREQARTSD